MEIDRPSLNDRYASLDELKAAERKGVDYGTVVLARPDSDIAVIAPHGGWIEPGTSEIARGIAGDDLNLFLFEGLRSRPHRDLHITSGRFDDPDCLALIAACETVVAIHGSRDDREHDILIGGRDMDGRSAMLDALVAHEWDAAEAPASGYLSGLGIRNICNRGATGRGVQLEIRASLRKRLVVDHNELAGLARAIRLALP
jgi:phage replication-related protein YjqB (UPF0714/DUF867 family)